MTGFIAGKVLASKNVNWKKDDLIGGMLPFNTVQIITGGALAATYTWNLTGLVDESNISYGIGVLGMPGSTAYGGLIDVLRPLEGETIFISAASGAVGSVVGQLAKHLYKCNVIGSVGGPAKSALVKEKFGFDHAIDYKAVSTAPELIALLKDAVPEGIDMYFENVGGIHFEAAMDQLRPKGRVAVCGIISESNSAGTALTYFNPMKMIYTAQRIEGIYCAPWLSGAKGNFLKDMSGWVRDGHVVIQETFYDGIEQWPNAFQALFTGANVGKVVVRVA